MAALEKTRTPGVYKKGNRYVVTRQHKGRQHKEFFATYAEAREAKGRRQAGSRRKVDRLKLGDFADGWIETYRGRTARGFQESTRQSYRDEIERRIKPYFGRAWLAEILPGDVKEWTTWMEANDISPAGIRKAKRVLSAMLADALEANLLPHGNPCLGVRYVPTTPEPPKPKPRGLTPEEFTEVLSHVPDRYRLLLVFMAHTGVRIGEALGLRWEHVELGDDPHVEIAEQYYKGERKVRPKTHHSVRSLPLSPEMATALARHKSESRWVHPEHPVFAAEGPRPRPLEYSNVRRRALLPAIEASGIDWPQGR